MPMQSHCFPCSLNPHSVGHFDQEGMSPFNGTLSLWTSQEQARHQLTDQISTLANQVLTVEPVSPDGIRPHVQPDATQSSTQAPPLPFGLDSDLQDVSLLDGHTVRQEQCFQHGV